MIIKPSVRLPVFAVLGALAGLITSIWFYSFLWNGFGYTLAGRHDGGIAVLCYILPMVCGALTCALNAEYLPQIYVQLLKGVLMAIGVNIAVFLWQLGLDILPQVLNGKLIGKYIPVKTVMDLYSKLCPLIIWGCPVIFAIRCIFKRTDRIV